MATKLFGTDGVRGVAGTELTAEVALALGRTAALESASARPQVLIVRDTRESGPMLEAALAAYEREGRRLVITARQVALVDAALRGERHVPRL